MEPLSPGGAAPVRVVLVDDEHLVRSGLRLLLGGESSIEVVGEAGDGVEAEQVIAATRPDVVLMDIRMPRRDGLETTRLELARRPDLAVLVLTTFDADDMVLGALRLGARGFLLKDTPPAELVAAVHAAARGRSTLSPSVLDRVIGAATASGSLAIVDDGVEEAAAATDEARSRLAQLTAREADVVRGVVRGRSNAQIGAELYVSVATVKTHLGHAYDKLGVDGRVQLALLARAAGLPEG
ncbi:response regulator transcription factor [Frigoribacterium faeni]|uniref:response regulator transcription factor n=1 Tax=Frigoribacterium faeni TaxID=145483 RepID=UPI0032663048|nr:DNA-binding NarL/FixJ family response regulator [Frigoribacterium faeni]